MKYRYRLVSRMMGNGYPMFYIERTPWWNVRGWACIAGHGACRDYADGMLKYKRLTEPRKPAVDVLHVEGFWASVFRTPK